MTQVGESMDVVCGGFNDPTSRPPISYATAVQFFLVSTDKYSSPRTGHLLPVWAFTVAPNVQSVCFRKIGLARIIFFTYLYLRLGLGVYP